MKILRNFPIALIFATLFFSWTAQPVFADGSHNTGLNCLDCHATNRKQMSLGGTIYTDKNGTAVKIGATIQVTDAIGVTVGLVSDKLGNFYRRTKYGALTPPFKVSAHIGTGVENMVATASGNCNSSGCHGPGNRIFVTESSTGNTSHNAGQNCLQSGCHSSNNKIFSLGGTIYTDTNGSAPQAGASIKIEDSAGIVETIVSDKLGNFYTANTSLSPPYKIMATYAAGTAAMASPAVGGCNTSGCHASGLRIFITAASASGGTGGTGVATTTSVGNTSYDGKALYVSKCKACHEIAAIAQPIVEVVGRGDDVSITKNAITTNKSRAGATTNMTALSSLTDTQLQAIINYTYPSSRTMAAPSSFASFPVYGYIETPVISADSAQVLPIAAGNLNSNVLNWQIGLPAFSGSVDIAVAYQIDSGARQFLNSNNQLSKSAAIWKSVSAGAKTNESITENLGVNGGNLSTAALPSGTYTLWLFVLPSGNFNRGDISAVYAWQTKFTK